MRKEVKIGAVLQVTKDIKDIYLQTDRPRTYGVNCCGFDPVRVQAHLLMEYILRYAQKTSKDQVWVGCMNECLGVAPTDKVLRW